MKKGLLFVIAACISSATFGQFKLGTEAGLTLFNTSHSKIKPQQGEEESAKNKTGLKLGIIAEYAVLKRLSLQTGVAYISKGFRYVGTNRTGGWTNVPPKLSARIDYLEIPLNLLVGIGKHLRIGAGGYFGYGIGGKAIFTHTEFNGQPSDREKELTMDNPQTADMIGFRKTDYGLLFSASYTLPLNTVIQVQYSRGLKDIMPDIPFYTKTETFKNWGIVISGGWYFVNL
jgi:hypothetical protein